MSSTAIAQESERTLSEFKFSIEHSDTGILLLSDGGTKWTKLEFDNKLYKPILLTDAGAFKGIKANAMEEGALFIIQLTETEKGIRLKGMKGTAWEELSFTLWENEPQWIDEYGMLRK
jgi:hypothetical protein